VYRSENEGELESINSNLEQHGRQDQIARIARVTVAKATAGNSIPSSDLIPSHYLESLWGGGNNKRGVTVWALGKEDGLQLHKWQPICESSLPPISSERPRTKNRACPR